MGFRFRKSIKLMPGVRLNVGKRGSSLSVGGRGGRITFGSRGTSVSASLPGTGISYRQRLASTSGKQPARRREPVTPGQSRFSAALSLAADGQLVMTGSDGASLPAKLRRQAFQQHGRQIEQWLEEAAQDINRVSESLRTIHLATPRPVYRSRFTAGRFRKAKPRKPARHPLPAKSPELPAFEPSGVLDRLFPALARRKDQRNAEIQAAYREGLHEWRSAKARHEAKQAAEALEYEESARQWRQAKAAFDAEARAEVETLERRLRVDVALMEKVLEEALGNLEWPLETLIDFEIRDGGKKLLLDVDLPEVEDFPLITARLSANGKRLLKKQKSQTAVRKEYASHVHGIGMRLLGEAFASLPSLGLVVISTYSQRLDKPSGRTRDEYLYSVRVDRDSFGTINFEALEHVEPTAALALFEMRRKMTKTGIFRPIEPFFE